MEDIEKKLEKNKADLLEIQDKYNKGELSPEEGRRLLDDNLIMFYRNITSPEVRKHMRDTFTKEIEEKLDILEMMKMVESEK